MDDRPYSCDLVDLYHKRELTKSVNRTHRGIRHSRQHLANFHKESYQSFDERRSLQKKYEFFMCIRRYVGTLPESEVANDASHEPRDRWNQQQLWVSLLRHDSDHRPNSSSIVLYSNTLPSCDILQLATQLATEKYIRTGSCS
jgi:hypothetical protein